MGGKHYVDHALLASASGMTSSSDCSQTFDVIVVGGGVEGSATAYYLTSRHTKNVLLLEQVG